MNLLLFAIVFKTEEVISAESIKKDYKIYMELSWFQKLKWNFEELRHRGYTWPARIKWFLKNWRFNETCEFFLHNRV
jgi:hypothetical protein